MENLYNHIETDLLINIDGLLDYLMICETQNRIEKKQSKSIKDIIKILLIDKDIFEGDIVENEDFKYDRIKLIITHLQKRNIKARDLIKSLKIVSSLAITDIEDVLGTTISKEALTSSIPLSLGLIVEIQQKQIKLSEHERSVIADKSITFEDVQLLSETLQDEIDEILETV